MSVSTPIKKFCDQASPAPDINTLIYFLEEQDQGNQYVYRGQVKDWGSPVLPSLYRNFISRGHIFSRTDPEYRFSLRRIGNRFIDLLPDSNVLKFNVDYSSYFVKQEDLAILQLVSNHPELQKNICEIGFVRTLEDALKQEHASRLTENKCLGVYKEIVDVSARARIRHVGLLNPFGFLFGMTLAQQYGFSSELLDFTSDIRVAAFFATHEASDFIWEKSKEKISRMNQEVGVIYRLPSTKGQLAHHRLDEHDYYTCPGQIHLEDLCHRFEDKSSPDMNAEWADSLSPLVQMALSNGNLVIPNPLQEIESLLSRKITVTEAIEKYFKLYFNFYVRFFRLLDFPKGTFASSRLGRQKAVVIVPDELRKTVYLRDAEDYASMQAIEDISAREGFDRFYFRHSDTCPEINEINREYLWPVDGDQYLNLVKFPIDPSTPQFFFSDEALYKRKDLIAGGYSDEKGDAIGLPARPALKSDYSALVNLQEESDLLYKKKYYDEFYQNLFHAAVFCQKGFLEDIEHLYEAREACNQALALVNSFTANILKHIILIGLGDIAKEYMDTWASAVEFAKGDQNMVGSVFKDLWYRRHQRDLRQKVIQYYDDFG